MAASDYVYLNGFWYQRSDGTGPYVQTSPGVFTVAGHLPHLTGQARSDFIIGRRGFMRRDGCGPFAVSSWSG